MATARAILQAHVDGLQPESVPFSWQWTLPTAVLGRETIGWGPGDHPLTVPVGTTLIVVDPPPTTVALLTVKGVNGDTGWMISSTQPTVLTNGVTGNKILSASAPVLGVEITYL